MPKLGRKTACAHCPWLRKSAPGYLGDDTPMHFYRTSITGETHMPCHMQIDYTDPEWQENQLPHVDLCAGTLIHFRNICKSPRNAELAAAVRAVEPSPHVFTRPAEWFEHHAPSSDATEMARKAMYFWLDDE